MAVEVVAFTNSHDLNAISDPQSKVAFTSSFKDHKALDKYVGSSDGRQVIE